ncbi:MAG: S-layer homology domain-containing protein, partial [Candidatus Saccharibacteria bacterium]
AVITAATVDGGKSDTCKVTVISNNNNTSGGDGGGGSSYIYVTGITLDKHDLTLTAGAAAVKLTAKITPANATNSVVSWTSSNSQVASVDNSGNVWPKAKGTAIITATTFNGNKTDSCRVTVAVAQPVIIKPEPVVSEPLVFIDLNQHWAASAINLMSGKGLVSGYADGTFKPDKVMSRLEFIVILCKTTGLKADGTHQLPFKDAARIPAWGRGYVAAAVRARLLPGVWGASLNSTAPVTRAEMAYMVSKIAGGSSKVKVKFKDKIPLWASSAIDNVVGKKLMNGYKGGAFKAGKTATRAEVCALMANLLNLKLMVK